MKASVIDSAPLFADLTEGQRALLAERMSLRAFEAGASIYSQGQPAGVMFFVGSGRVRLLGPGDTVLTNLGAGALFGDTDVLSGRSYSMTAEAGSDVALWALATDDLAAVVEKDPEIWRKLMVAAGLSDAQTAERHLKHLGLLSGLTAEQIHEVAGHLSTQHFSAGQPIYRESMPGEALYIVEEGEVSLQTGSGGDEHAISRLGSGEFFGESALLTGEPHAVDAIAATAATLWVLDRADFEALVLRYPSLALNLSRALSRRLRQSTTGVTSAQVTSPAALTAARGATVAVAAASPASSGGPARPVAPATGAVTGLEKAANSAASWWGASSSGAKLRLVALVLLLIWLLFIALPSIIRGVTANRPTTSRTRTTAAAGDIRSQVVLLALAADLPVQTTPTYTPWPTETPMPTETPLPTATPTETPIPTATPTETPVPPTATPLPPTPAPQPPAAVQPAPQAAPAAVAAAPKAAVPSVMYKLTEIRRMTPCENRGNHHIFIQVMDPAGNPLDGVTLVQTPRDQIGNVLDKMVSGTKGPGKAEFVMWKMAEYAVYVTEDGANPTSTDIAQPLHPNFVDEANCSDGEGGNTLFHNSFAVVFQKTS